MSFSPTKSPPSSPTTKATLRSRSPPLSLPVLSTTLPGMTPFDRAVHVVNINNNTSQGLVSSTGESLSEPVVFSPVEELQLYGAYKQGTKGDVDTPKPAFYEINAGSRWQAWANMKGKTQAEAQDTYVDLVVQNLTKRGGPPDHHALADEILQRPPTPPPAVAFPTANSPSLPSLPDLDKNPLSINTASHLVTPSTTTSYATAASRTSEPYQQGRVRESSTTHSTRSVPTGELHSTAPPAYEISTKSFPDGETGGQSIGATVHHGVRITDSGFLENSSAVEGLAGGNNNANPNVDDGEDSDEEAYQSSLEFDEDDKDERQPVQPVTHIMPQDSAQRRRRNRSEGAGVFDEEEKDERESKMQGLVKAPQPMAHIVQDEKDSKKDGSVQLGYRVSLPSAKVVQPYNTQPALIHGQDKNMKHSDLVLPPVYSVNALYDTVISPPTSEQPSNDDNAATRGTFNVPSIPLPSPPASEASFPTVSSPSHPGSTEEPVCPVSKKTASSGGVCPAAMFAQARANSHAGVGPHANTDAGSAARIESTNADAARPESAHSEAQQSNLHSTLASPSPSLREGSTAVSLDLGQQQHHHYPHRAMTAPEPMPPTPPVSASAVSAATNQGMRIGQGIVNRFSALRSSLAAASARATSLATGNGSSTSVKDPRAVVVKDPVTNQSVTVMCPHMNNTQVMETEIVRLQTDISVLHERLDALQETLQLKSESQAQARRSPRGFIKMVLRQGLINAILLLIVFAILYKRKSPIAYAILAYVGQGRKDGEAGWRALMRWSSDMIKTSQKNQQNLLRAGRRNGYW